jgi:hypothetical protein
MFFLFLIVTRYCGIYILSYFLLVYVRGVCLLILLYTQVCRLCGCEWDMRGIVAERQDVQIGQPVNLPKLSGFLRTTRFNIQKSYMVLALR